jgi:NHL repeat
MKVSSEGQAGEQRGEHARRAGAAARAGRLLVLPLLVLLVAMASEVAPASALIHRGHVFASAFGQAGAGQGQFDRPSGVAVDEASGALYVLDAGNERVEVFSPDGAGGYAFSSEFKVRSPIAIAVDNSASTSDPSRGEVYVVGGKEKEAEAEAHEVVYEYSPSAKEVVHRWTAFKAKVGGETEELELEDISGVSVDANGLLWVYWETEGLIDGFSKQASKGEQSRLVWEPGLRRSPEIESKFECFARPVFAVAPAGDSFYAGYERENAGEECPGEFLEAPDPVVVAKLDATQPSPAALRDELVSQNTTGAAVDPSNGDVYLDNVSSISALTAQGTLIQRFGSGQLAGASGAAVDASTGQVFVAEPGEDKVVVFAPEGPGTPVVDSVTSQALSPTSTELRAQIDAHGREAEYEFQYGTSDCVTSPSSCTDLPAGKLPAEFGDQQVRAVVSGLTPATAYFYRVVLIGPGETGEGLPSPNTFTTLPSPSVMPDGRGWELVSPPEKHGAAAPELISRYRGGSIQASSDGSAIAWLATGPVVTDPEGNRSFEFTQLLSRRDPSGWSTVSLETPHAEGRGIHSPTPSEYHFFSSDLSQALLQPTEPFGTQETPPLAPEASEKTMYVRPTPPAPAAFTPLVTSANDTAKTAFGGQLEFVDATSDLKHVLFESTVALTAAAPGAGGLYEWEAGAPLRLVSVLPDGSPAPDESGRPSAVGDAGGLNARNAISSDGTRVFWTAGDEKHLYLRDASVGEEGQTILINAAQGHGATAPGEGGNEVPEPPEAGQEVAFQSASSDGSKVFFTDTARLTEASSLEPAGSELQPADLYELELTSAPGQPLQARLSDLTAESSPGRADVLNLIPGSSEDGSRAYFVANGVLAAGASPGDCPRNFEEEEAEAPPPPGATCNLYVTEADPADPARHATRWIAALSPQDAADWGAGLTSELPPSHGNLSNVTSRVSPDGRYLTFMSEQSLTGYDNRDATSGEADEEVYLYDAQTHRLACASCNSADAGGAWQRPQGVFDTERSGEGVGLLVDRPELWHDRWLAASIPGWAFNIAADRPAALYQPRYLSDAGRLYFDSADALVAQDTNEKEDVYQYEPQGDGDCARSGGCVGLISSGAGDTASAFLDASESGDDVFFLSAGQLVATDQDNAFDVYDAHVCSASSPCVVAHAPSTVECASASACREPVVAQSPPPPTPASSSFSGPGNTVAGTLPSGVAGTKAMAKPLTRAQKLAKALKACRKSKGKHKRVVCQKKARQRYGAKSKKTKHRASARKRAR